jgi:Tol biopolymer transport system component
MGLLRLEDGPVLGGHSESLRAAHPDAGTGPVLSLPTGWEPCWVPGDIFLSSDDSATEPSDLRSELSARGWLVLSTPTSAGDWDLVLMRPDGSQRSPLTRTDAYHETGARFSPDGRRLLYYRQPRSDPIDNNRYGTYSLIIADADGRHPVELGAGYPWASWGPDGRHIACLQTRGIEIVDVQTQAVVRKIPRHGIVSQLAWSPDGRRWAGTANGLGPFWNIGCLEEAGDQLDLVSESERYNCTPDWMPDSRRILYARGIVPDQGGRAELAIAHADGSGGQTLFADSQRHVYGACASPDGKYVVFTRSLADLGSVDGGNIIVSIVRLSDTPMLDQESASLRRRLPDATLGPRLDLGAGWEPDWTFANVLQN